MKRLLEYAIMPIGKNDASVHDGTQKAPEVATLGLFYSVFDRWLKPKAYYQLFFSIKPFADEMANHTCHNRKNK